MAFIELHHLNKAYGKNQIFQDFSLQIEAGEMVAVTGVSGAGKSTLLNILGLIEQADSGVYTIDGVPCPRAGSRAASSWIRTKISYLFQNGGLIEEDSVYENLMLALSSSRISRAEKKSRIQEALARVGMAEFIHEKVYTLSGGQQQRTALARAMIKPGEILLADEPTGALDEGNKKAVLNLLRQMADEGRTVVMVTHDLEAARFCDRRIDLAQSSGRKENEAPK